MLSIKHQLKFILQRAILSAFPIKEEPIIHHIPTNQRIFEYDYICYTPKLLFEKYKRSNSFYGLFDEKAVAEDIKIQISNNDIISKVNISYNGDLQIKLSDQFIIKSLKNYRNFILHTKQKNGIICLPSLPNGQGVDYEIFRAINIAEKLQRLMIKLNYKVRIVLPLIDMVSLPDHPLARLFILKNYGDLLKNQFFNLDHDILLSSQIVETFSDFFKSLSKDSKEQKRDLRAFNLSLIMNSLRAKYDCQHNLIIMARAKDITSTKQTINNNMKQNKELGKHYHTINEFYFGGLFVKNGGKYASDEFLLEDFDEPRFEIMNDYVKHIEKVTRANSEQISEIMGDKLKAEELFKILDIYSPSHLTRDLSKTAMDSFLHKTFFTILQTYQLLKEEHKNKHKHPIPVKEFDDFGRSLAVKLLRYNDVMDEVFHQGEIGHALHYWEDLALLWHLTFENRIFESLNNRDVLVESTLVVYKQFFEVFFGCASE